MGGKQGTFGYHFEDWLWEARKEGPAMEGKEGNNFGYVGYLIIKYQKNLLKV
jgi:hypothetical protein